jgi:peptidase A4-like protein
LTDTEITQTETTHTDVLTLMHTYDPPPAGFDPHTAAPALLRRHGLPRRPDPATEPELARLFKRAFIRPARYVKAELAIDPVMSRRDPLGGQDPDFGPSGWGGVAVVTSSLGYSPPEPASTVFAEWVVPEIIPWDPAPAAPITVGFWVGLDGFTNGQVLQAGIAATLTPDFWLPGPASVNWWAWTEWYTTQYQDPAVQVTNFPVATGNTVSFLVCAPQPDHGFVSMQNLATGQVTSVGIDARPGITSAGASAEWIVEGISADLPDFLPVTFSDCSAGTQHHAFNLTGGVSTNIQGSAGPLTQASIASPTAAVVQWEGWS